MEVTNLCTRMVIRYNAESKMSFISASKKHSRVNPYDRRKLDYKGSIDFSSTQQKAFKSESL